MWGFAKVSEYVFMVLCVFGPILCHSHHKLLTLTLALTLTINLNVWRYAVYGCELLVWGARVCST